MPNLFRSESSDPKRNAQRNLSGRTHYVDDDTLRWHKARVLSARVVDGGLLFAIVESVALDMRNTKRGVRYVIFDIFGNVVGDRKDLEHCWRRSEQAEKAMWVELNTLDAAEITRKAVDDARRYHAAEMERVLGDVAAIEAKKAA